MRERYTQRTEGWKGKILLALEMLGLESRLQLHTTAVVVDEDDAGGFEGLAEQDDGSLVGLGFVVFEIADGDDADAGLVG